MARQYLTLSRQRFEWLPVGNERRRKTGAVLNYLGWGLFLLAFALVLASAFNHWQLWPSIAALILGGTVGATGAFIEDDEYQRRLRKKYSSG